VAKAEEVAQRATAVIYRLLPDGAATKRSRQFNRRFQRSHGPGEHLARHGVNQLKAMREISAQQHVTSLRFCCHEHLPPLQAARV
jgi:hypothetical protein